MYVDRPKKWFLKLLSEDMYGFKTTKIVRLGPSRGFWCRSQHSKKLLALKFYLSALWETSFIIVTGTKTQHLATNVRLNLGFQLPQDDRAVFEGLITLSSWHPCRVHVILIQILKRNNPKECAMSSQSTAQCHIITATFAIKSRARHCSKHGFIAF